MSDTKPKIPKPSEAIKAVQELGARKDAEAQEQREQKEKDAALKLKRIEVEAEKLFPLIQKNCAEAIRQAMESGSRSCRLKIGDCVWLKEPPTDPALKLEVDKSSIVERLYQMLEQELVSASKEDSASYKLERVIEIIGEDNRIFSMDNPGMDDLLWRRFRLFMKISF